jgi:hypothetical protein
VPGLCRSPCLRQEFGGMAIAIWPDLVKCATAVTVGLTQIGMISRTDSIGQNYRATLLWNKSFRPMDTRKLIVESYASCALTVSKDKLSAISGIAQKYIQIILKYLYGPAYRKTLLRKPSLARTGFVEEEEIPCAEYATPCGVLSYDLKKFLITFVSSCQLEEWIFGNGALE